MSSEHPVGWELARWRAELGALGERPYRASQVYRWIHRRGVLEPGAMSDLALGLRERLRELGLGAPLQLLDVKRAADGTRKLLLGLHDGGRVECVVIPMTELGDLASADADAGAVVEDEDETPEPAQKRITLCISTQFGCAMGCVFCASGQAGLRRGLGAAEIVSQVLLSRAQLEPGEELRNLVFMGMGEPLHHYAETRAAIRLLTDPEGAGMSPRRITVSTVGLVPGIRRLGEDFEGKVGLAVSLHAPDDATRSRILPMNERYPLAELMRALREYPLPRRRRITIEYTLIDGINDSQAHAERLVELLDGLRVKVNLIPMNSIAASDLHAPSADRVRGFRELLARRGLSCFLRVRRGSDVDAACGQLALAPELVPLGKKRGLVAD